MKTITVFAYLSTVLIGVFSTSALASPATYNAVSGYGTCLTGGTPTQTRFVDILPGLDGPFYEPLDAEVVMENIALATEVNEGNGFIRLGFTLTLRNNGPGYYEECFVDWEPVNETWHGVQVGDSHGFMPDLLPDGTANDTTSRPQPFEVRVPAADRNAAVAQILLGQHLRPAGIELFQFNYPAVAIDQATDEKFDAYQNFNPTVNFVIIDFSGSTPLLNALQPGTLLVESAYRYTLARSDTGDHILSDLIQDGTVPGILRVLSVSHHPDGSVTVSGVLEDFTGVLDTGTFFQGSKQALDAGDGYEMANFYRPKSSVGNISVSHPLLTGFPPAFEIPEPPPIRSLARITDRGHPLQEYGFRPLHVPFNDISFFNQKIKLSGEILLDALDVELKLRVTDSAAAKVTIRLATKAELTMRVAVGANTDNRNAELFNKEKQIFSLPLPPIMVPIGGYPVRIQPSFVGKIGATVNTPTTIVIPIHGSIEAGCVMGWDGSLPEGQQFFYRPYHKSDPLHASDPLLNDSLALEATAFAEAGINVTIGGLAGPYFGARVTGNFDLTPGNDPWWNLDLDFNTVSKLKLTLLWFDIADLAESFSNPINIGHHVPSGPLSGGSGLPGGSPPGPFDPVSGGETRWARTAGLFAGSMKVARVAGSDEDVFAAASGPVLAPPILRIGAKGEVLWAKGANFIAGDHIAALPDGGCVLASGGGTATIVWLDGNGNATAARLLQPQDENHLGQVFYLGAMLATPAGDVFVAGSIANAANDPFLAKYDSNKNLVFFKRFQSLDKLEVINGMCLHPDGDLLICGQSDGPGLSQTGGLLMRVSTDGNVEWARRTLSPIIYNSVTTSPDGKIYTAGRFIRTVTLDWPGLLVAEHSPEEGGLVTAVLVGERMANTLPQSGSMENGVGDDKLEAGTTPYDSASRIAWTPNGLIVSGSTANLPAENTRAGVVMCLTERFGLRWYSSHDGQGADDSIFDIVPTGQGIFTAGYTKRGGPASNGDARPALFHKLPLEGRLDLPGIAAYLQPSVMALPGYSEWYPGIATPPQGYQGNEVLSFTNGAQNFFAQNITPPVFNDLTPALAYSPPRQVDPSTGQIVVTHRDLWRLTEFGTSANVGDASDSANPDGDRLNNFLEYASGADPLVHDSDVLGFHLGGSGQGVFGFSRIADPSLLYQVQASDAVTGWSTIYSSTGAANQPGLFEVLDPGPVLNGKRFFRLRVSE